MMPRDASRRRVIGCVLGAIAVLAAALAVWARLTPGFKTHVFGFPVSIRGEERPAFVAVLLAIASLHFLGAWRWRITTRAVDLLPRIAPWIAAGLAGIVLLIAAVNGSRVAGGSDASGYVSQAALWLDGRVKLPPPEIGPAPWPHPEWTFSPLGYRPDERTGVIVPTYAPGLPLLMAAFTLLFGVCGPYLVTPVCAGLLVVGTYWLGARLSGWNIGLIAAFAVAVSPAVLFMVMQPMSDIPNAAFWILALLFASFGSTRGAAAAGLMSGLATLVRPNLAPLILFPAALASMTDRPFDGRTMLRRAVAFAAGCAPFVIAVGAIFNHLYGSPLRSGYGSLDDTYAWANGALNLARYPRWFLDSQGPVAFAFLLTPAAAIRRPGSGARLLCFAFVLAVFGCYTFYTAFEEWWYLRFVLPAFPLVFILGGEAVGALAGHFGSAARNIALCVFAAAVLGYGLSESLSRRVLDMGGGEKRYAAAARYIQRELPKGAVVIVMQHSGSINYYTDKLPMRYDSVDPEWMDRAVEYLNGQGHAVYALLDDWEIPIFEARFRGHRIGALGRTQPVASTEDGKVLFFSVTPSAAGSSPVIMPEARGCLPRAAR